MNAEPPICKGPLHFLDTNFYPGPWCLLVATLCMTIVYMCPAISMQHISGVSCHSPKVSWDRLFFTQEPNEGIH